jgi:AMIN domain-containing protein
MRKRWTSTALALGTLVCLVCIQAYAQETSNIKTTQVDRAASRESDTSKDTRKMSLDGKLAPSDLKTVASPAVDRKTSSDSRDNSPSVAVYNAPLSSKNTEPRRAEPVAEKAKPQPSALNPATVVRSVRSEASGGAVRVVIGTDGVAQYKDFVLSDPPRVVVDITGVHSAFGNETTAVGVASVERFRVGQPSPNVVRVVLDTKSKVPYRVTREGSSLVVVVGGSDSLRQENIEPKAGKTSLGTSMLSTALSAGRPKSEPRGTTDPRVATNDNKTEQGHSVDRITIDDDELRKFQPNKAGRLGRAFQYKLELVEQTRSLLAVLPGTTTPMFIENPERFLQSHSLTFKVSELFPSSTDLVSMVKRAYGDKQSDKQSKDPVELELKLCGGKGAIRGKDAITCLTKAGSWWRRTLAALSGTFAWSERPAVQQGIVVAQETFTKHYGPSGQIDFDPAQLFITATNWKKTIDDVKAAKGMFKDDELQEARKVAALDDLKDTLWEYIIPKFQIKSVSQFDFIKSGVTLIPAPFPQSALTTLSLTWDLTRRIHSTQTRVDAAAIRADQKDYEKQRSAVKTSQGAKLCVTISGGSTNLINVPDTFSEGACQNLAREVNAKQYTLACIFSDQIRMGDPIETGKGPDEKAKPGSISCGW